VKYSKKIKVFCIIICCLAQFYPLTAVPRGNNELIPCGHWVYDALMAVSLENGTVNFADSAPLSVREIKLYLNEVNYNTLSVAGRSQYDRIITYFKEQNYSFNSGILSLGIEPSLNPEAFYKSNSDIDWIFDRYNRKAFIDVPATFSCGDVFTMSCDLSLGQNKGTSTHDYNWVNIPLSADEIDVNFPSSAYFSTSKMVSDTTGIGFQVGLGPRSVGRSLTGSMILSEYLTGTSWAQFTAYSPNIRYNGSVDQFNVDKYLYLHQIDVRLFNRLSLTAMEGMLVYAPLELRFLNPWTIFHGFAPWRDYETDVSDSESYTCAYMCLKAEYVVVNGVRIYGLFAQDQYQTPYELANWPDDDTPNGIGGQLGTEAYIPAGNGYIHFCLEGSYADPFLYIKESPNWSLVRTYSESIGDMAIFYEWIGSPFGPDTMSAELTAGYEVPSAFSVNLTYLYMCRGEMSGISVFNGTGWGGQKTSDSAISDWVFNDSGKQSLSTPTGTPEYVNRLSVRGTWYAKPWLQIAVQPGYVCIFNYDHESGSFRQGFEVALAFECSLFRL
jgi:hypothetical protein